MVCKREKKSDLRNKILKKHCLHIILQFPLKSSSLDYTSCYTSYTSYMSVHWTTLHEPLTDNCGHTNVFLELFSHYFPSHAHLASYSFWWWLWIYLVYSMFCSQPPNLSFSCQLSSLAIQRGATPAALHGRLTIWCLCSLGLLGKWIGLNLNPSSLSRACLCMINFLKMFEK